MQGHEIHLTIQRNNPAVEQRLRFDQLPAEIVCNEKAVIGFHLKGSFIIFGKRVEIQIEHLEGQLAPGHDHRPFDADPAVIDVRDISFECHRYVRDRIEHENDLPPYGNGMRNIYRFGKQSTDGFGNGGFAVSGRAINENRLSGADGRAEPCQERITQNKTGECLSDGFFTDDNVFDGLRLHHPAVSFQ